MTSFFFSEKDNSRASFLHRLDPRVKIISFFFLIAAIVFTSSHDHYKFLVYFFMLVFMTVLSRIPFKDLARRLVLIFPLLIFLAAALIFFERNPFSENLDILWNLFVKSILCFLCLAVLILTTEFYHLVQGLGHLKVPRIITSLLSFAYRYSFLFAHEAERLRRAKESRSFGNRKKLEEVSTVTHIVPHLFFKTFERSERIYAAMLSRGYEGKIQTLSFFRLGKRDFFFVFLFHIFLAFAVIVL